MLPIDAYQKLLLRCWLKRVACVCALIFVASLLPLIWLALSNTYLVHLSSSRSALVPLFFCVELAVIALVELCYGRYYKRDPAPFPVNAYVRTLCAMFLFRCAHNLSALASKCSSCAAWFLWPHFHPRTSQTPGFSPLLAATC